jgi:DNA-binding transcriptional MerR regulator
VAKSPEAFRTISEVAADLGLPQHVLRFWETRFVQIRPMKRGGGRRYYRPDDIDLLRGIRTLLYGEGYTIRGVQRILKEQGPRFVIGAGRGDMSDILQPELHDDTEEDVETLASPDGEPEGEDEVAAAGNGGGEETGHIEPTFDPREFRPRPAPAAERTPGLAADEIRQLQGTLSDLLELKRLLDQARG